MSHSGESSQLYLRLTALSLVLVRREARCVRNRHILLYSISGTHPKVTPTRLIAHAPRSSLPLLQLMSESRFAFGSPTASMMEHDDDDGGKMQKNACRLGDLSSHLRFPSAFFFWGAESRESTPTWHNTSETKPKKKKGFWRLGSLRKRIGKGKKKDRGHASSASFDELDFSSSPPPRATSAVPPEIVKSLDGSPVYRRRFPKTHSLDRIDTSSRVDGKTGNDAEVHVGGGEVDSSSFAGAETASTESRRRRKSWQMAAQNQNRTLESQDSADFVTTIRRAEVRK